MDEWAAGIKYKLEEFDRRISANAEEIKLGRERLHRLSNVVQASADHERRLTDIESQNVEVLSTKFSYLERQVAGMTKALWGFAFSLLLAAAVFALSVASGQIG